jgi:hypothetical protein
MRSLLVIGAILLILGIASIFVPIPRRQRHGIEAGGLSVGFQTTTRETVHPIVSGVLIGGGILLMIAGNRSRR